LGLSIGATFIARSFSGDKEQLVPIIKAAAAHRGFALLDVISPCVTFNDHEGSTKSYLYTRQHMLEVTQSDFVPPASEILAAVPQNGAVTVTMHDGSAVSFRAVPDDYDPTDRQAVQKYLSDVEGKGEIATGLLYVDEEVGELHEVGNTSDTPLVRLRYEELCPGSDALDALQSSFR
jgi:2-oxoglutarate ferredoxin oxidoreductase subunit beta